MQMFLYHLSYCAQLLLGVLWLTCIAIAKLLWLWYAVIASMIFCKTSTWNYDDSHSLMHHIRVAVNALRIALSEHLDFDSTVLILVAALVHDSVDHKYCKDDIEAKTANLKSFLEWTVGAKDADRVYTWITHSSYSKEKARFNRSESVNPMTSLGVSAGEYTFTRILADADRLDSISGEPSPIPDVPMGVYRSYIYNKNANPGTSDEIIWKNVWLHCDDKLNTLDNWIYSTLGKEMARAGCNATKAWYQTNIKRFKTD